MRFRAVAWFISQLRETMTSQNYFGRVKRESASKYADSDHLAHAPSGLCFSFMHSTVSDDSDDSVIGQ